MKSKIRYVFFILAALVVFQPSVLALTGSDIQSLIGETPYYDPTFGSSALDCISGSSLVGTDNIQKALSFFIGKGLPVVSAAGIIGNLEQESGQGLHPFAEQTPGSWEDMSNDSGHGVGLAQWDGSRRPAMINYAESHGLTLQDLKSASDQNLSTQLDYLWQELTTNYTGTYSQMKSETDITQATTDFMNGYEGPGSPQLQNRIDFAKQVLSTYSGSQVGGSSSFCSGSLSINCNNSASASSNAPVSQVRQNIVCVAQAELALWVAQPGYPHPAYSQSGYYKYSQNRPEEWCADFVSWVYDQARFPLQPDPNWNIAYVPNIQSIGEQGGNFHWHPGNSYVPKPGDLAIHGSTHINIFISSQGGTSQYIGGDQGDGPYPGGSVVSIETGSGYYDNGITGYVSPD